MQDLGQDVVPPYMIGSKEAVKETMSPVWTKKNNLPNVTESYHTFMCNVSDRGIIVVPLVLQLLMMIRILFSFQLGIANYCMNIFWMLKLSV